MLLRLTPIFPVPFGGTEIDAGASNVQGAGVGIGVGSGEGSGSGGVGVGVALGVGSGAGGSITVKETIKGLPEVPPISGNENAVAVNVCAPSGMTAGANTPSVSPAKE